MVTYFHLRSQYLSLCLHSIILGRHQILGCKPLSFILSPSSTSFCQRYVQHFLQCRCAMLTNVCSKDPRSKTRMFLCQLHPPHTELLDLRPLPVTALGNKLYENLYRFSHFNPIQTQVLPNSLFGCASRRVDIFVKRDICVLDRVVPNF